MTARKKEGDSQLAFLVDQIKQQIIFGRLRPRERLIEDELSERYRASRHLVRSAFAELESMGLVTRRPNKGAIVRDFSVEEVEQIYEMRAILQSEAARRIPLPLPKALLERIERIHAQFTEATHQQELQRVCTLNNEFHRAIFAACGNRCLAEMIDRLWIETLGIRCYALGDPQTLARSLDEHGEILDALRAGDRNRLTKSVVDHIWPAMEAYKRAHGGWSMAAPGGGAEAHSLRHAGGEVTSIGARKSKRRTAA